MSKQGDDEWQGQPDRCNAPFACCPNSGLLELGGGGSGALCIEIEFYADISQESRCNSEIKVSAPFYKILVFL
jgi:hypothetical protein